jgi:phosphopentomutase
MPYKFIIIVLDSLGIGAMPDTQIDRPADAQANTLLHILERMPKLHLPHLCAMGLINVLEPSQSLQAKGYSPSADACFAKSNLAHTGADSFWGHQEIMGTLPSLPLIMAFAHVIDKVEQALLQGGYKIRRLGAAGTPQVLIINEYASVGDNLEADLGSVYNVTGLLDLISFNDLLNIGQIVRKVVQVARVITFGGRNVSLSQLQSALEVIGEYAGINAPKSGVYKEGYQVLHLGFGVDHRTQLQYLVEQAGYDVALVGKAADILYLEQGYRYSGVESADLFEQSLSQMQQIEQGLIVLNIQQTDLAGHAQDVERYAQVLELCDEKIGLIQEKMHAEDILVVMADHGNDPTIGHGRHTRERVPLLLYGEKLQAGDFGTCTTMSDVAATALAYFDLSLAQPKHAKSLLGQVCRAN